MIKIKSKELKKEEFIKYWRRLHYGENYTQAF
jgi:hypothetical protein